MPPSKKPKIFNKSRNLLDEGKSHVPVGATAAVSEYDEPSPSSMDFACNNESAHTNADQCATDNSGADAVSDPFEIATTTHNDDNQVQPIQQETPNPRQQEQNVHRQGLHHCVVLRRSILLG